MARYDRIARIDPPPRDGAFPGWLSLRDLEGREREPELGRRARLRYLALRPIRRLLLRGLDGPDAGSLDIQVDAVRQELKQLPARDPERERLIRYLEEIGGRSPSGMVRATLDVGENAEAAGHLFAAEEFYITALELADAHEIVDQGIIGLRRLGRVYRLRQEWQPAIDALSESIRRAEDAALPTEWARSMEGLAAVHLRKGEPDRAREILDGLAGNAPPGDAEGARAIAAAGRCALEIAEDRPASALNAGWEALSLMAPGDEARQPVLLNMAAAFRRLGLHDAAASCYRVVVEWSAWPEHRTEARLELAVVAAEAGSRNAFRERRRELLENIGRADRPLEALIDLGLGRGSLLVGAVDEARDHLRDAIATARDIGDQQILDKSEELLQMLESRSGIRSTDPSGAAPADARRIADRIESLARETAPSS